MTCRRAEYYGFSPLFLITWGCSSLHPRTSCATARELRKLRFLQLGSLNGSILQHTSTGCECWLTWQDAGSVKWVVTAFTSVAVYIFTYLPKLIILLVSVFLKLLSLFWLRWTAISEKNCFLRSTKLRKKHTAPKVTGNAKINCLYNSHNSQLHKMDSRSQMRKC